MNAKVFVGYKKGKDYDHTTGKFISVKSNRGGQGNGTKGKPKSTSYKVNKKSTY